MACHALLPSSLLSGVICASAERDPKLQSKSGIFRLWQVVVGLSVAGLMGQAVLATPAREALPKVVGRSGEVGIVSCADASRCGVSIGLMDVAGNGLDGQSRFVGLTYREFGRSGRDLRPARWLTASGRDHGREMAITIAQTFMQAAPVAHLHILSANVFVERTSAAPGVTSRSSGGFMRDRSDGVLFDSVAAERAFEWFAANNVRIVVTASTSQNAEVASKLADYARSHGILLVASAGNDIKGAVPALARQQGVVSVAGDCKGLPLRENPLHARQITIAADCRSAAGRGLTSETASGSSFAAARVAGWLGAALAQGPRLSVTEVATQMGSKSEIVQNLVGNKLVSWRVLNVQLAGPVSQMPVPDLLGSPPGSGL